MIPKTGIVIFVLLILYYGIVIFRLRIKKIQTAKPTKIVLRRAKSIIGKSTYTEINLVSNNQGFKEAKQQPLQVDFEMENDEDEDILDLEAEEMELLTQFDSQTAQGLSFEEMSQAVDAIQQSDISDESERRAIQKDSPSAFQPRYTFSIPVSDAPKVEQDGLCRLCPGQHGGLGGQNPNHINVRSLLPYSAARSRKAVR